VSSLTPRSLPGPIAVLLAVALAAPVVVSGGAAAGTGQTAGEETATDPVSESRIVAAYPDPVAGGDAGEFVVVDLPPGTDAGRLALGDGETTAHLPNATLGGEVVLATRPEAVPNVTGRWNHTDRPVVRLRGRLELANGGEELRLRRGNRLLDRVAYDRATEGAVRRWNATDGDRRAWRPLGATDRPVVRTDGGRARAFVLPDGAGVPVASLRDADRRLLLAGYTLTSRRVARALRSAAARGVTVRVLVEGGPVGGITRRQAEVLDGLVESGIPVTVIDGPRARYRYHHAKYAVVDDRVLVLTENWKPSGTGGRSNRGWGVLLSDERAARVLARTFRADADWRDGVPWQRFRRGETFRRVPPANGSYPTRHEPRTVPVRNASVLVAPDNAQPTMVRLIDGAERSVRVVQVSIDRNLPLVRALERAARRGVRVRVLLSGAWYTREENRNLTEELNRRAERRDWPLTARLARSAGRYDTVHAKGLVVDGEHAAVGSLNWNDHAVRNNREVVLVLEGTAVGGYYAGVFDADWSAGRQLPVGVLVAVALGAVFALALARRIRFGSAADDEDGAGTIGWRPQRPDPEPEED